VPRQNCPASTRTPDSTCAIFGCNALAGW
jgi:hypothetical protein